MVVGLVVWSAALCWVWFSGVLDGLDRCIIMRCSVDGNKASACHAMAALRVRSKYKI